MYDFDNKTVTTTQGTVVKMPPDDGFDAVFFHLFQHPNTSFEELLKLFRVDAQMLFAKMMRAGHVVRMENPGKLWGKKSQRERMEFIDSIFKDD